MKKLLFILSALYVCQTGLLAQNTDFMLQVDDLVKDKITLSDGKGPITSEDVPTLNINGDNPGLQVKTKKPFTLYINDGADHVDIKHDTLLLIIDGKISRTDVVNGVKLVIVCSSGSNWTYSVKKILINTNKSTSGDGVASGFGQIRSFYHDAFYLKAHAKDKDAYNQIRTILLYYAGETTDTASLASLAKLYRLNPYLKSYNDSIKKPAYAFSGGGGGTAKSISSLANNIGGLDVTSLADGISKFLVKRTKQELNEAFFNRFREFISKDDYKDLRTVFPQTYSTMSVIGSQIYSYEAYIQSLKESFNSDFKSLPDNFPKMIDNNDLLFDGNVQAKVAFKSACYITAGLRDEKHIGNIIAEYPEWYLTEANTMPNFKSSVHLLQLLSESLKDSVQGNNSRFWISNTEFNKLVKDKDAFYIYLGFLHQVAKRQPYDSILFTMKSTGKKYSLINLLDTIPALEKAHKPEYERFRTYIKELVSKTTALNNQLKTYNPSASDSMKVEQFYSYMNASLGVLEHCTKINTLPYLDSIKIPAVIPYYTYLTRQTGKLVVDVNRRNYAMAVVDVITIYDTISQQRISISNWEASIKRIKDKPGSRSKADNDTIAGLQGRIARKETFGEHTHKLFRYASFMAAVAKADNSDQVSEAIEAFAMPSGSARVKREAFFNVALNAYVGPYIGSENINNVDKGFTKLNAYGLTAPIGISAGWGWGIKYRWSTTLFISLVDLGAVTAFRFRNDSISEIPKIQLKDLFSPGAFVSIGLPRCPLSLNLGAQMGPNLRKVSNNANPTYDYGNNIYWRLSASICVDIPLLNFYTSTRRKVR